MHFLRFGIGHIADLKIRAIRRHSRLNGRGHTRREIPSQGSRPVKHNLRPIFFNQGTENPGIWNCLKVGQSRILDNIHAISAVRNKLACKRSDLVARKNRAHWYFEHVSKLPCLAAEFKHNIVQRAVFLLCENPNFSLAIWCDHD